MNSLPKDAAAASRSAGQTLAIAPPDQADDRLRASEELLLKVLGSSHDCIKLLDVDARLLWMNACGRRVMQIQDFQPLQNTQWLDFWPAPHHLAAGAAVAAARAGQSGTFTGYCPTTTGIPKWWDVVISPVLDAAGRPEKLLAISRDITERQQAEEALQKRAAELERFHRLSVGRELQMIELKQAVNALSQSLGRTPPYALAFLADKLEQPNQPKS